MKRLGFIAAAMALLALAVTARAQSYAISWSTIDGGGGASTGGGYTVTGTIGQGTAGGSLTDGLYSVTGGFGTGPVTAPPPTAAGLAYFQATGLPEGRVVLTWGTLVEVDTLGYRVERNTPGGAWEPVSAGIVPAEGSDERPHDYRFEEATPAGSGGLMYRLVVIDVRGDERVLAEALVGSAVEVGLERTATGYRLTARGAAGGQYVAETTTDLASGVWTAVETVRLDPSGLGALALPIDGGEPQRFCRLRRE